MKLKRCVLLMLMALAATGLSGCFSLMDWEHNSNHTKVWNNNLKNAHRSIDLYVFGYDWNDPTIPGLSYEE